jgi:HK97 family phage portal protein
LHAGKVDVLRMDDRKIVYDIRRIPPEERPTDKTILMPSEVLHVPGLGFNGIVGQSVLHFAREQLGEAVAAQQFGAGFYAGGASPILALKHPIKLREGTADKLRRNWEGVHGGSKRRIAVLDEGWDLQAVGMPQKDMQFLDSRVFYSIEIARWFGMPPHRLKDLSRATYSNIAEQQLEWAEALLPWLVRWEQEFNRKLFTEAERKTLFCEHVTEGLLRGDIEKRYGAYATAVQWGWMSRNEVRRRENLNQLGAEGDEYMVPVNMQAASQLTVPQETMTNAIAQTT